MKTAKKTIYRGYAITKTESGDNYRVQTPRGWYFGEHAANIKTARKWIDCHISEGRA